MKQSPKYSRFGIIHHYNSPNSAITVDGKEVRREEKILYVEYDENDLPISARFIMCAPYSEHFVYLDPMWTKIKGRCSLMCTCGSMAVVVGYNAYKKDASPSSDGSMKGEMIVCKWHLDNGVHQTGGRSWQ